jgi:CRISPR-associated protein Cmr4
MQSLNQNLIMNMVAQTSIHAGAGQALSVIDLPIQRESHTQFPVIFGSSLKGALRFRASQVLNDNKKTGQCIWCG